ncbi:MAG: ribosome-associated translation inhibitor RaiA [Clostridia bacterium]|nr:ribosome-associated translation inhibitor RaiA [Clostridia bacterium]
MKMNFTARQMRVFDSVKENAEKKLAKFDKFFKDGAEMDITFSMPNGSEMVEITIRSQGIVFRAEEAADTFATAIDSATEALERQIRKNKTRLQKKLKSDAFTIIDDDLNGDNEEEEYVQNVRTKTFPFKPMGVEEAILQMNMLGHDFFVYKDADTLETCVVYRRKHGGYGLIVPE